MTKGVVIKLYGDQQSDGAIADSMTRAVDAQSIEKKKKKMM